ncbi:MAG TPA: 3-dehydroquinate synthase [Vicinamibacterales bacterium]|nr:3-dehydroquinate synthase [Vicinamibacterales bacterium]
MASEPPAESPGSRESAYGFAVPFSFPVLFTRAVWNTGNPLLADIVAAHERGRRHRLLVFVDDGVAAAHPALIRDISTYITHHRTTLQLAAAPVVLRGGETAKVDFSLVLDLLQRIHLAGLDRQSFVVAVGGGAVLDVVSFAAAIAHRGIRTIRMPTTVLAQDDSGIAVKTSVNMFGKKNFAGTFTPPFAVLNDLDFLDTLSRRDRVAGLSEAVKVALLRDPALLDFLEDHARQIAGGEPASLEHVVRRSAELHLAHICGSGDPFEFGSARPLDFGHWAAHKLETLTHHRICHGEAVSIGIALDVTYSVHAGFLAPATADRVLRILEALGLPIWDDALSLAEPDGTLSILAGLREFQEHLGGDLHVTMLRDVGRAFELTSMDHGAIRESVRLLHQCASATPSLQSSSAE